MKSLLKKINVFGLGLVLVCGVVFATQSAFKGTQKFADLTYGYQPNALGDHWVNITGGIKQGEEGEGQEATYGCLESAEICTATFPDNINPNLVNSEDPGAPNYVAPQNVDEGDFFPIEN